jgi:sarcosine oxidase
MGKSYDVIVVGIGGMGSATCWQLARRGQRVLGIERFDIGHANGSSHGVNRIIRLAYYEHPDYVPLLKRAYGAWRETETAFGEQLLYITGSIDAGPEGSRVLAGSLASCAAHDLEHEAMDGAAVGRRFPGWQLPAGYRANFQPDGGFVASERAINAHVMLAMAAGADIHARETVTGFEVHGGGVRVTTGAATHEAGRLVLSAGAWIGDLVPALRTQAVAERQVLGWFAPRTPAHFAPSAFPVGIIESEHGHYYVLPQWGQPGVKIGRYHHLNESGHADALSRQTGPADTFALRRGLRAFFPDADGPVLSLRACLFTNTPDEHFIIDTLPGVPEVIVASPCSGHGFKFASVIGEILADLATGRSTPFDLSLFGLGRFAAAA